MWRDLGTALCLVLVIEGMLPFLSPRGWKAGIRQALAFEDRSLRMVGLSAMLCGAGLLYLIR